MAHTLKAYYYTDPATAVTVDFYGAVASNSGIAVDSYQMGIPGVEQARNNSLYSDSPRPVYSKHGTVTDVLTVTVRGSTNTLLYTNLHYLAKLGEYARMGTQNPYVKATPYLELTPSTFSGAQTLYAPIYDCRVEMPQDWAGVSSATTTIEDVTVTIERGIWRDISPNTPTLYSADYAQSAVALASGAASSADIGGDTSALWYLTISQTGTPVAIDRAIIGFRSKNAGGGYYDDIGKFESESATNGTDTSDAVDATASGGNCVRCTFGTTTTAAVRSSGAKIPVGVHRMFARMKITGSAVASVYIAYADETAASGATFVANDSVLVSSTGWLVYDLGIVRAFAASGVFGVGALGTYQVYASLERGTGNLDIDWVYCMPTEGYITIQGMGFGASSPSSGYFCRVQNNHAGSSVCYTFVSKESAVKLPAYTASLNPPPGPFALYWILGTDSGSVFDAGITSPAVISLKTVNRYIMPSEV